MLGWLKSLFSPPRPSPGAIVRARMLGAAEATIRARYDNAQSTDENQRGWWMADYLSAKSANNFQVRRQLRNRSRYEVSNNPYLYGVANGNADDLVGTGPTLKCLLPSEADNKRIEAAWREWAQEVNLTEKLRTLKLAKTVDGEGFLVLKTVRELENPVKLYPVDIEADQVTTPAPTNLVELWVDGLDLHPVTGRPVSYHVLKHHPGDYFFPNLNPLEVQKIRARYVVHWYPKFRPGQVRGVPVFTPALDLFNELRAFRKAVLEKAKQSAQYTSVIETDAPAVTPDEEGALTPAPLTSVPIDRGVQTALPAGWHMKEYQSGNPATTYSEFQKHCLGEAIRPLAYPLNLALGTSQEFNFSSAQLDHRNYYGSMRVERADCNAVAMSPLFRVFIEESALVPGLLPPHVRSIADVPHEWHWPGFNIVDPVNEATADHARLSNGTDTFKDFWARRGRDWQQMLQQQAAEKKEIERLNLVFGDPLKKSDTVTEDKADDGPPKAEKSAKATAAPPLRAGDPDQPRDEQGRWAKEDAAREDFYRREAGAIDRAHTKEGRELDKRQGREQKEQNRKHDGEDKALRRQHREEERAVKERRDREDEEVGGRHDREHGELADRHEREGTPEGQRQRERDALDRRHDAENDADGARREKEDYERWARQQREEDEQLARQQREIKELAERHDAENRALREKYQRQHRERDAREAREKQEVAERRGARADATPPVVVTSSPVVHVAAAEPPDLSPIAEAIRDARPAPPAAPSEEPPPAAPPSVAECLAGVSMTAAVADYLEAIECLN